MFWGIEVSNKEVKVNPSFDLHITTACLAANSKDGRTVLQVKYDGKTYCLCSLRLNGTESNTLDTNFEEGKEITFQAIGPNTIHLTGYFVDSMYGEEEEQEEDGEDAEEEDDEEAEGEEDDEEEMEEDDEEDEDEEDDEEDEEALEQLILSQKRKASPVKQQQEKKLKTETTPVKKEATPVKQQQQQQQQSPAKQQPVKKEATPVKQQPAKEVAAPAKKEAAPVKQQAKERTAIVTLNNGLQYEDIVVGTGVSPKAGKKVGVKYIGKLTNGKTFDSSLRTPFVFRIGVREVISGWDIGVMGMKVGGKRRLTIPAKLAYGSQSLPGIPANSTLVFDVELMSAQQ